jgi:DNA-binding PadR family transcriptional regulator
MTNPKMLYEDVLNEVMLAEDTPSHAALLRWTERYPDYAEDLAKFFATWAMQEVQTREPEIDEEKIVERAVSRGLEILRRQGRLIEKAPVMEPLTPVDQAVLYAIYLLHGDADLVSVTKRVREISGDRILPGSTVSALSRLEDRGLIQSWADREDESEQEVVRQYFSVTLSGERALAHAKEIAKVPGDLLGDIA